MKNLRKLRIFSFETDIEKAPSRLRRDLLAVYLQIVISVFCGPVVLSVLLGRTEVVLHFSLPDGGTALQP